MPRYEPHRFRTESDVHPRMNRGPATVSRPITVVWCEDDPQLASFFEALWRIQGLVAGWRPHEEDAIHFARDGDEALRFVEAHAPDLFVTDLYHPGPNGLELLQQVAADPHVALGCVSGATLAFDSVAWVDFEVMKAADLPRLWVPVARVVSQVRSGTYQAHADRIRPLGD